MNFNLMPQFTKQKIKIICGNLTGAANWTLTRISGERARERSTRCVFHSLLRLSSLSSRKEKKFFTVFRVVERRWRWGEQDQGYWNAIESQRLRPQQQQLDSGEKWWKKKIRKECGEQRGRDCLSWENSLHRNQLNISRTRNHWRSSISHSTLFCFSRSSRVTGGDLCVVQEKPSSASTNSLSLAPTGLFPLH